MSDDEERRLVRRVREGDDAALAHLRTFWLRSFVLDEALGAVAGAPLGDAAVAIVTGRVALMWAAGEKRWTLVAFERDEVTGP